MKLLAIDDDAVFLELLSIALQQLGYTDLTCVSTAAEGLSEIESAPQQYECVLLDILMPEFNGIEFCKLLRAHPVYHSTPILMITAASEKHFVDEAFMSGATDFINKPIDLAEIKARLNTIGGYLEKSRELSELHSAVQEMHAHHGQRISFEEPMFLEEVDGLVSLLGLENYLFKVGRTGMFTNAVVGFHVVNGYHLFAEADPQEFLDMMADLGDALWDAMDGNRIMFAYAGGGDFVAIVSKSPAMDASILQDKIDTRIDAALKNWISAGVRRPLVVTGEMVNHSLISFASPTDSITRALTSARARSSSVGPVGGLPMVG